MLVQIKKFIEKNFITLSFLFASLITVVLRFSFLTRQSHWADEIVSVGYSNPSLSFREMLFSSGMFDDIHPPFYQILLWCWYNIFGYTEYAGRSFSALIGCLGVIALFLLAKAFFNKEVALYATMIASMNYYLVNYSQETRSYSLLFLLTVLSYFFFYKVITKYKVIDCLFYLPFAVALLYTHYFGFILVGTQAVVFLFFIFRQKEKRAYLIILGIFVGIILLVSIYPLLSKILANRDREDFWIATPDPWFFIPYMYSYANSAYLNLIFLFLLVSGARFSRLNSKTMEFKTGILVLWIWLIFGYLLPYLYSLASRPILQPRYTIIVLPALILLVSHGIYIVRNLVINTKNREFIISSASLKIDQLKFTVSSELLKIIIICAIGLFSFHQLYSTGYYRKVSKQQWREVLFEISKATEKIPAYDLAWMWSFYMYDNYNNLLQLGLDIHPFTTHDINTLTNSTFKEKLDEGTLKPCFYLKGDHSDLIEANAKFFARKDLKIAHVINRNGTSTTLYAYKADSKMCTDRKTLISTTYKEKLKNGTLEKCFFVMDGHSDLIGANAKFFASKDFKIAHVINRYGTSAVLYANKVDPKVCTDLFPNLLIVPSRHNNRHGAWY